MKLASFPTPYVATTLAFVLLAGCSAAMEGEPDGSSSGEAEADYEIVSPGKADNYYSNVSNEFELTGTLTVEMTEEDFEDEAIRDQKISERLTAVGLYLTAYLTEKLEDHFDNMDYGGFQSMVRNQSVEREEIAQVEAGLYEVRFTIDAAGPPDFLERLQREGAENTADGVQFSMQMPEGATSNPEFVSRGTFRRFDPADHNGELETVTFEAIPLPEINDSYPHYRSFAQDGVYDITVFFGHDYNEDRWDLQTAREVFDMLRRDGFESPVDSFDALDASSGPFTKSVDTSGLGGADQVEIQVRLYHADMYEGRRSAHKDRAIEELRKRDVFYYWGHAGPYYGFSFSPNDRADLDYQEIAELELSDKDQLVIASGCQTYSQYADMLYANPAKSEENLDVITTVNYSNLVAGDALLAPLVDVADGAHRPKSFYELVEAVNSPWATSRMDTFYGVIGLDGNPQLHPYANPDSIGASCETNSDCGAHVGANVCVHGSCAARALAQGACPSGSQFGYLGRGRSVDGGVCH